MIGALWHFLDKLNGLGVPERCPLIELLIGHLSAGFCRDALESIYVGDQATILDQAPELAEQQDHWQCDSKSLEGPSVFPIISKNQRAAQGPVKRGNVKKKTKKSSKSVKAIFDSESTPFDSCRKQVFILFKNYGTAPISCPFWSEEAMAGDGKNRGEENLMKDAPPKSFRPPFVLVRFPHPSGVIVLFFLCKNPRLSRPEALLEVSRNFREGALSSTFFLPPYVGCCQRTTARKTPATSHGVGSGRGVDQESANFPTLCAKSGCKLTKSSTWFANF